MYLEDPERDPALGERIVWRSRPKVVETPPALRAAAVVMLVVSGVSVCFAVVVSVALEIPPVDTLLYGLWSASLALACWQLPKVWLSQVEYLITERHVVMQRGPFRRTIERRSISFARIFWNPKHPGVGDIELVRAVPTGALRRRLLLHLRGIAAPDRVWAIIRGAELKSLPHRGDRPLTQRLDDGEHVLWSAAPRRTSRAYLPQGRRELTVLALSLLLMGTFAAMVFRALPTLRMLLAAGLPDRPAALAALLVGESLGMLLVLAAAAYMFFDAVIRPVRMLDRTRYLITNQRVLIQRGPEELHLDRSRIVDVIPTRAAGGLTDVFLVLDGPRARALAISGAFGESDSGPSLSPVLFAVEDAEAVSQILLTRDEPASPKAA